MLEKAVYRLGSFRIIEYEGGLFRWEKHSGLGEQKSGPCYVKGEVLIIGKPTRQGAGFLILEFDERLRKCPPWNKTPYYCHEDDILVVELTTRGQADSTGLLPARDFRLGNYLISVHQDGDISWSVCRRRKAIARGQAWIRGDILFLDNQTTENYQDLTKFAQRLESLPAWDATSAWCPHPARRVHMATSAKNSADSRRLPVDAVPSPEIRAHTFESSPSKDSGPTGASHSGKKSESEPEHVLHEKRRTTQKTIEKAGSKMSGARDGVSSGFSNLQSKIGSGINAVSERRPKPRFSFGKLLIVGLLAMLLAILIAVGFFLNEHREPVDRHHDSHERERRRDH